MKKQTIIKLVDLFTILVLTTIGFVFQFKNADSLPDTHYFGEYLCYILIGVFTVLLYHDTVKRDAKAWVKILIAVLFSCVYTVLVFGLNNIWRAMRWNGTFGWSFRELLYWLGSMDITYHVGFGVLRYPLVFAGMLLILLFYRKVRSIIAPFVKNKLVVPIKRLFGYKEDLGPFMRYGNNSAGYCINTFESKEDFLDYAQIILDRLKGREEFIAVDREDIDCIASNGCRYVTVETTFLWNEQSKKAVEHSFPIVSLENVPAVNASALIISLPQSAGETESFGSFEDFVGELPRPDSVFGTYFQNDLEEDEAEICLICAYSQ